MNEIVNEEMKGSVPAASAAGSAVPAGSAEHPERKPFSAGSAEISFAFLSYIAAYFYVLLWFNDLGNPYSAGSLWKVLPVAAFAVSAVLVLNRGRKVRAESWFWLACFVSLVAAFTFRLHGVWDESQLFLFIHASLIWWTLSHSGKLLDGESSRFLPVDGLNGFVIFPFRHFFLRIRCVFHGISRWIKRTKKGMSLLWTAFAVLLAAALFAAAASLLMQADNNFAQSLDRILQHLEPDEEVIVYLILSLPVGAYIFGLIGGTVRTEEEFRIPQPRKDCRRPFSLCDPPCPGRLLGGCDPSLFRPVHRLFCPADQLFPRCVHPYAAGGLHRLPLRPRRLL